MRKRKVERNREEERGDKAGDCVSYPSLLWRSTWPRSDWTLALVLHFRITLQLSLQLSAQHVCCLKNNEEKKNPSQPCYDEVEAIHQDAMEYLSTNPWYGFLTPWGAKTFPRDHWLSCDLATAIFSSLDELSEEEEER
jgi:hypothetical protein